MAVAHTVMDETILMPSRRLHDDPKLRVIADEIFKEGTANRVRKVGVTFVSRCTSAKDCSNFCHEDYHDDDSCGHLEHDVKLYDGPHLHTELSSIVVPDARTRLPRLFGLREQQSNDSLRGATRCKVEAYCYECQQKVGAVMQCDNEMMTQLAESDLAFDRHLLVGSLYGHLCEEQFEALP